MTDADSAPTAPPSDDKDWTWVLQRPCPECGAEVSRIDRDDIAALLRDNISRWVDILGGDEARVRRRPDAEHWSALEYAAHVRDVCRIYTERLRLMLTEDGPHYANWDQNVTALEQRYDRSDPALVAIELASAGGTLAAVFDSVSDDQWARTGYRSDGAEFTIESFARYFIHDPVHHLDDVARGFASIDAS